VATPSRTNPTKNCGAARNPQQTFSEYWCHAKSTRSGFPATQFFLVTKYLSLSLITSSIISIANHVSQKGMLSPNASHAKFD